MVFFYTLQHDDIKDAYVMYMGKDKFENEELLKYAWPEDVWFHVDDLSSAHVYLRLPRGVGVADIPQALLTDCSQFVKANSIEGNKQKNVKIVYTAYPNLSKTPGMEIGQVGFKNLRERRFIVVPERENAIINRIKKTMTEITPAEFKKQREQRDATEREQEKAAKKKAELELHQKLEQDRRLKEMRSYKGAFDEVR